MGHKVEEKIVSVFDYPKEFSGDDRNMDDFVEGFFSSGKKQRREDKSSTVYRLSLPSFERYSFDWGMTEGWQQWDTKQDASYFGIWVHRPKRMVMTYCEGDASLDVMDDDDAFKEKIRAMEAFHGDPPHFATTIDHDGTVTRHYDERMSFSNE